MLTDQMIKVIQHSKQYGWLLEPDAKTILKERGMNVPRFSCVRSGEDAIMAANQIGYPLVAKVVSYKIIHKSDVDGVAVNIMDEKTLLTHFKRFSKLPGFTGMMVEEMVQGTELIIGSKIDYQFGPVILMGMGGTHVEIFQDTAVRMAPLTEEDILSMIESLKSKKLMKGYRGSEPVNMNALIHTVKTFSEMMMEMEDSLDSADLNPVICSSKTCYVADARFILKETGTR